MRKSEHEADGCERASSIRLQEEALPDRKHCGGSKPQVLEEQPIGPKKSRQWK